MNYKALLTLVLGVGGRLQLLLNRRLRRNRRRAF